MTLSADEIGSVINKMKKEAKEIKRDALRTVWYMRGGISYNEAMLLDFNERNEINDIIKENLDTTKRTGLNFF